MYQRTREYLNHFLTLHREMLDYEFHYLKEKYHAYVSGDYEKFKGDIEQQRKFLDKSMHHFAHFEEHRNIIVHELFPETGLTDKEQRQRLDELLTKDHFLTSFVTEHAKNFKSILDSQKRQLARDSPSKGFFGGMQEKFRKMTNTRLIDYLHAEETLFSEFLSLYIRSAEEIPKRYQGYHRQELISRIEKYIFEGSAAVTAVPLGPLELLSIPLWGSYFAVHEIRKLNRDFEKWQKVNKPRITRER